MKKSLIMLVCAVSLTACADNEPPPHKEVMNWGNNCLEALNTLGNLGSLGEEGQRHLHQCISFVEVSDFCNPEQAIVMKKVDGRVSELLGVEPETFMCVTSE